jgi:hypothetical protein
MSEFKDGPHSPQFKPLRFTGSIPITNLDQAGVSQEMIEAVEFAPKGDCVGWGIHFEIGDVVLLNDKVFSIEIEPVLTQWLIFMHTSDLRPLEQTSDGVISPMRGQGQLGELAAEYIVEYSDGEKVNIPIRRRFQIGAFQRRWGENCFEALPHKKPHPLLATSEQVIGNWGLYQTRVKTIQGDTWLNWIYAWENPFPDKSIIGIHLEPKAGKILLSAISTGNASSTPTRWRSRHKAILTLPEEKEFSQELDEKGLFQQIKLDLGQVISATPRLIYPDLSWSTSYNNQIPEQYNREVLVEYTSHPEAHFHLLNEKSIPVKEIERENSSKHIRSVKPSNKRVVLRVIESKQGKTTPVKLHIHGEENEYLAPKDRHRKINPEWFQDYGADFVHLNTHACTYITGETVLDLPLGKVHTELSKGFEYKPIRKTVNVTPDMDEITIEIEKVLPWREKGWVTADTHVHFLSPTTALLEGSAEDVNVINLLASQWGELITNVGDFDGKTTWGSTETGGDGEHLVRVGSENRQYVLGHISLLGYSGNLITPLTTGGPDESAIGDPVERLLSEWADQCKQQGGLTVLPHFPDPRCEQAAVIVSGMADGIEMTSWGDLYGGINPYSLSDWYRYLNCGYLVPAVGGTDKMQASTPVGAVRTYAHIGTDEAFNYDTWMKAIHRKETFVTYGPLLEFAVNGQPMGSVINLSSGGGTLDVTWNVASATVPMSRVELMINGEIRESKSVQPREDSGSWSIKVDKSSWIALMVRGHYADKPEIIAAHSTPILVNVEDSPMMAAADAVTILEQIEGALAYIDTIGTRADDKAYKRMRLVLEGAHRKLHNRMHQLGYDHEPIVSIDHEH